MIQGILITRKHSNYRVFHPLDQPPYMAGHTQQCGLNRGPWTPEEDRLLTKFIEAHGEGRWRILPQSAGLMRCRKSCRLRWKNYLRPNLKRDHISEDEEELIIRLHKLLGNRWSLIAGRMPGRTDSQIKNYWHTHLSKKATNKSMLYSKAAKLQQTNNANNAHASCESPAVPSFCSDRPVPDANQNSEGDLQNIASTDDNRHIATDNLCSNHSGEDRPSDSTIPHAELSDFTRLLSAELEDDWLMSNLSEFSSNVVCANHLNIDLQFSAAIQEDTIVPKFDNPNARIITSRNRSDHSSFGPPDYVEDVLTYHEAYSTISSDLFALPLSELIFAGEYNQNVTTNSYHDAVASATQNAGCISDLFEIQWPYSSDIGKTLNDCALMHSEHDYILWN